MASTRIRPVLAVTIDPALDAEVREYAETHRHPLSWVVADAIAAFLKAQNVGAA